MGGEGKDTLIGGAGDGTGAGARVQFGVLTGAPGLSNADFIVV